METNVSEQILDRIAKLLNMTTENGCTEAEASVAAQKAQGLLDKYNLRLSDLRAKGQESSEPDMTHTAITPGKMVAYQQLLKAVAETCYCKALRLKGKGQRRVILIGDPVNVQAATLLFNFLRVQVEGLRKEAREEARSMYGHVPKPFVLDFTNGICDRLVSRLKDDFIERTRSEAGSSIVVFNDKAILTYAKSHFRMGGHSKTTRSGYRSEFYGQGYDAGSRANIRHSEALA